MGREIRSVEWLVRPRKHCKDVDNGKARPRAGSGDQREDTKNDIYNARCWLHGTRTDLLRVDTRRRSAALELLRQPPDAICIPEDADQPKHQEKDGRRFGRADANLILSVAGRNSVIDVEVNPGR